MLNISGYNNRISIPKNQSMKTLAATQGKMKIPAKMACWGFFSGIIISVFLALFFDFFDFFPEKPYSFVMTYRDEESLLFCGHPASC